jgi:hypothetical protein
MHIHQSLSQLSRETHIELPATPFMVVEHRFKISLVDLQESGWGHTPRLGSASIVTYNTGPSEPFPQIAYDILFTVGLSNFDLNSSFNQDVEMVCRIPRGKQRAPRFVSLFKGDLRNIVDCLLPQIFENITLEQKHGRLLFAGFAKRTRYIGRVCDGSSPLTKHSQGRQKDLESQVRLMLMKKILCSAS